MSTFEAPPAIRHHATSRRFALAAVAVVFLLAAACRPPSPRVEESAPPLALETARATVESLPDVVDVDGVVVGREEALVASRLAASVEKIEVTPGQEVLRGTVLVRLSARETEGAVAAGKAALAAARTSRDLARKNRERYEALRRSGTAAVVELDRARIEEASTTGAEATASAALRRAETDLSQAILRAPFDAVVVDKLGSEGDLALPGRPLLRLASRRGRRVEAAVAEADAVSLRVGQGARIGLGDEVVAGRIAEIVGATDAASRRRIVRVDLPDGVAAAPGGTARLLLDGAFRQRLSVPESAVTRRGGLTLVWVVAEDGVVAIRYVAAGAKAGKDRVEIRSGLQKGERVVVSPPLDLVEGARVAS